MAPGTHHPWSRSSSPPLIFGGGRCIYLTPPGAVCGPPPQVFFTRNGKIIGKKEAVVPAGGYFPTVGMLSSGEKVKVDLHPLSG